MILDLAKFYRKYSACLLSGHENYSLIGKSISETSSTHFSKQAIFLVAGCAAF